MTGSVQSKSTCWLEPGDLRFPAAASVQRTSCWSSRSGEVQSFLDHFLHAAAAGAGNPDFSCILTVAALVSAPVQASNSLGG